jgi:hypothetical protein
MIVLRTWEGIRDHYPSRQMEWFMIPGSALMGAVFLYQPDLFSTSKGYSALADVLPQEGWAVLIFLCTIIRLVALIVNGTFHQFSYSPHLRAFASVVCMLFWFQFGVGVMISVLYYGGGATGVVAYLAIIAPIELRNLNAAIRDVSAKRRR